MNQLDLARRAVEVITSALDANSLVRDVTHAELLGAPALGAKLVGVNKRGVITTIATYGIGDPLPQDLSIWDSNPIAGAIRARTIGAFETETGFQTVLPFYKALAPVGALLIASREQGTDLEESTARIIAGVGAFYMEASSLQGLGSGLREGAVLDEITQRQKEVLNYMAQGQTNAEISRAMLLSESTIRQETVRIYRSLGVSGRLEASRKAKALGIL